MINAKAETHSPDAGRVGGRRNRLASLPPIPLTPVHAPAAKPGNGPIWRALRRAVQRVTDGAREPSLADAPPQEVVAPLEALIDSLRQTLHGETPSLREVVLHAHAKRLLGDLRRAFLAEIAGITDQITAADLVAVLRAFDQVERIAEQDCTQRFMGRLATPEGPALVVEIAHDMRSPLASILFLVETLRNGQSGPVTPVQDRQLGLVYSAAFGLSSLTSDVVELARGGERLLDTEPMPFSLLEIFNSVRDITQPIAEEKGLGVRLLPPEADWRVGCAAALQRVLLNLTTNALKYTSEGSVEVSGRQISRTSVEFSVTDTGRGIPADLMACLFETFRADRHRKAQRFSSAGLGLSICRKLVRRMGGHLEAESAPNAGTRIWFTLELPLAPRL